MRVSRILLMAAGAAGVATAAAAHSPYLSPTTFAPDHPYVTVEAAMTEGNYFVPAFPIRAEGDFVEIGPDGSTVKLGPGTAFKELTIVEAPLPQEGTWRIGTGERAGRAGKWVKIDGQWRPVRPDRPGGPRPGGEGGPPRSQEPPREGARGGAEEGEERRPRFVVASEVPPGAETMESQSFLKSETYVTRGAPSPGALKPSGQGLELVPVTHPNEIYAGEPFKFDLTYDGQPAPAQYTVARAGDAYAEKRFSASGKADAAGKAALTLPEPGVYVMEIHYPEREEGPSAAPLAKSTTYTLTFEVTP